MVSIYSASEENGNFTFTEVAPLHDFLKYGQNNAEFPVLAPRPNTQSDLLSNFCGPAVDGAGKQRFLALDDVFVVKSTVAEDVESSVVRAKAVSANVDWSLRRWLRLSTRCCTCRDRRPRRKGRDNPCIVLTGVIADEDPAKTLFCGLGLFAICLGMQQPRQRVVGEGPS